MTRRYGLPSRQQFDLEGVFPAQSSVLDEEALLVLITQHYDIPTPAACRFLTRGAADIYRVKITAANYYLKVYRPPQSLARTEAEAQFISALATAGLPVVKAVAGQITLMGGFSRRVSSHTAAAS